MPTFIRVIQSSKDIMPRTRHERARDLRRAARIALQSENGLRA